MTMIVTRAEAAAHLHIDDATPEADDLDLKIEAASGIALDYIERDASYYAVDPEADPVVYEYPAQLKIAVLLIVADLHRYRDGGDTEMRFINGATLSRPVRSTLYPLKSHGIEET